MTKQRSFSLAFWAMVIIVVLIIIYGAGLLTFALTTPSDRVGVHVQQTGFVVDVAPDSSSLRKGDVILRINGRDINTDVDRPGSWYNFLFPDDGAASTYVVQRDGQQLVLQVPWQMWRPAELLLRIAPFLIVVLSFMATALLIGSSRTYDPVAALIALEFCVQALNLANNAITSTGANLAASLLWFHATLDLLTFSLGISLFLHVLLVYPERKWLIARFPASVYLVHAVNIVVAVLAIAGVGSGTLLQNRFAIFGGVLFPIAAVELVAGMAHLVHTYLTSRQPGVRNQIRWVMWGVLLGPLPWLLLFNIPVALFGAPLVPLAQASLPLILVSVAFFFSVTRRGLVVVDMVINRSVVYVGVTVLLVGIYLVLTGILEPVVFSLFGVRDDRSVSFVAVFLVVVIAAPLRAWFQTLIDRAFYRRWSDFKSFLRDVGRRLSTTLHLDTLVPILEEDVPRRLRIAGAALLVRDDDHVMRSAGAADLEFAPDHPLLVRLADSDAPVVLSRLRNRRIHWADFDARRWELVLPLRSGGKLTGLYLLGPRLSGDLYDRDELETLVLLGQQIAVALANTRLYHQVEVYSEGLADLVDERTHELALASEALGKERDRLNVIIQNMADGLLVVSETGHVVLVNPAFEDMIGQSRAFILDRPASKVLACPQLVVMIERVMVEPGIVLSGDCLLHNRILRASSVALRDASGTITVVRDVTHEVEVDRMKTEFISSISHELRTPLTSVLGFTKLIQKSLGRDVAPVVAADPKGQRVLRRTLDNLDIIVVESERLVQLVNDVLDIAKMESGKIDWNDERFGLETVVQRAVDDVMPQVEQKEIMLEVNLDPRVTKLVADPDRIYRVLVNLLSNAVKFTDDGCVTLATRFVEPAEMAARWAYPPSNRSGVLVSVRDTGLGIPKDEIPQLFQRFKQVWTESLVSKPQGTGLGLAMCRGIVVHYGGYIWVESEVGKGSDFQFVLPLSPPPAATEAALDLPSAVTVRPRVRESISWDEAHEMTVLVVDDDANVRSLLVQELEGAGYSVLEASNGIDALATARRYRPSAIILDVMMPGLSGFDVVQLLKSDLTTAMIPIIILSIIEDREKGLVLGADAYLTKPVEVEVLLDTLVSVLSPMVLRPPSAIVAGMDQSALEQVSRVLREQGFQVAEAYDSRGAIVTAQQTQPDVVVLDAMMASLDNAQVIKALRFQQKTQAMTVIVVAGMGGVPEGLDGQR